jgi:DNA-binding transcriptional regulator YdaS (Cro superfamily)
MTKQTRQGEKIDPGLQLAIDTAGGARALARLLGIRHQTFTDWKRIPAGRILQIEAATGIPRERLRPDLYRRKERAS